MAARDKKRTGGRSVQVVGFGLRAAAFVLDATIVWFLSILLGTLVGVVGVLLAAFGQNGEAPIDWLVVLSGLIFSIVYFTASWSKSGQTLGKMAVGIKIVGHDGKPPSAGRALLRYVGYIVSALALSIGFLWVALDKKRQGWHDKLAGTYVIMDDENFSNVAEVKLAPADRGPSWVWIVLWVFLALTMPAALLSTVLSLGPYLTALLASILGTG